MFDPAPLVALPPRPPDAHKGLFGRHLVLGGSRGLIGAAAMAGESAIRAGAGLVTIGCPRSIYPILAAKVTCPMTWPLPETDAESIDERAIAPVLERADAEMDACAIGPGLGRHEATRRFVRMFVERVHKPFVCDADAIFAVADDTHALDRSRATGILTPHAGEMARLLGTTAALVQKDRVGAARRAAAASGAVVLLKGHGTVVTDGARTEINRTGNPGMATGGAGDVLTGIVATLLAQRFSAFDAARLGAHVHGLAGDLARDRLGETSLIATDLLESLPEAFRRLARRPS